MSLSNELFSTMYSTESASTEFNTYFKKFKERGNKLYGRLIAMSKKLNNEDNKVDTYIKSLKARVKLLENPTGLVKNVTDQITAELLFNDVLCKYKTIHMNKGNARKHIADHIAALKSLLDSEPIILSTIKESTGESSRVVANFTQLCKHVMWSTSRLLSRIRLEPYAGSKNEIGAEMLSYVVDTTASTEGILDWFRKWREEAAVKKAEKKKQEWKQSVSSVFEDYYNWLAESELPNDIQCIPFNDLYTHISATVKIFDHLKNNAPYKYKNRMIQTEAFMKVNSSVKGHYNFDTSGFSDVLDRTDKLQTFKGSGWDNVAKLKQMYKEIDAMDDKWYGLIDLCSMHIQFFNTHYHNNTEKTDKEITDMRNVVVQWVSASDWILSRSIALTKQICHTLNTM